MRWMVAVKRTISTETPEEVTSCRECLGTGMVSHWSEIAYFEDRRACALCDAGSVIDSNIADMVKRAQVEERLSRW